MRGQCCITSSELVICIFYFKSSTQIDSERKSIGNFKRSFLSNISNISQPPLPDLSGMRKATSRLQNSTRNVSLGIPPSLQEYLEKFKRQ